MRNASTMFNEMYQAICINMYRRESRDTTSPMQKLTYEAVPGKTFTLTNPELNVVSNKSIDLRWAYANALHFFTGTEDGKVLLKYNSKASRFLEPDGRWDGAYGAIAMPQIRKCIELLRNNADTRRAIVSMGECEPQTINRPACWSMLQFLQTKNGLDMVCYQRSMNLFGVMPYDLVILTNIMKYVAYSVSLQVGHLHWTFGSLHMVHGDQAKLNSREAPASLLLPYNYMHDPVKAASVLHNADEYPLNRDKEIYT
jgi:thymidylate synthase